MLCSLLPVIFPFSTLTPPQSRNISSHRHTHLSLISWNRLIIQVSPVFSQLGLLYDWTVSRCVGSTSALLSEMFVSSVRLRGAEKICVWKVKHKSENSIIMVMPNYRRYEVHSRTAQFCCSVKCEPVLSSLYWDTERTWKIRSHFACMLQCTHCTQHESLNFPMTLKTGGDGSGGGGGGGGGSSSSAGVVVFSFFFFAQ